MEESQANPLQVSRRQSFLQWEREGLREPVGAKAPSVTGSGKRRLGSGLSAKAPKGSGSGVPSCLKSRGLSGKDRESEVIQENRSRCFSRPRFSVLRPPSKPLSCPGLAEAEARV